MPLTSDPTIAPRRPASPPIARSRSARRCSSRSWAASPAVRRGRPSARIRPTQRLADRDADRDAHADAVRRRPRPVRPCSGRPSRSTVAATATASGCRSTAPAAARWPARPRPTILAHYYQGTTLGIDPDDHADPGPRPVRMARHGRAAPLLVYGRRDGLDDRRHRDDVPGRRGAAADPRRRPRRPRHAHDLAAQGRPRRSGTVLHDGPKPAASSSRGATGRAGFQLWSKPASYDQYRGILRIIACRRRRP